MNLQMISTWCRSALLVARPVPQDKARCVWAYRRESCADRRYGRRMSLLLSGFGAVILALVGPVQAAEFERFTTDDGLRVLFMSAPEPAMVDIQLTFAAGAARDGELEGLAALTARALAHGAGELDADALAEAFEGVGAQFSADAGRDMGVVSLRSLTEPDWLERALQTLTTVLAEPRFPAADFERSRRQTLRAIQREGQEPGSVARRALWRSLYPDHPYGAMPVGRAETVEALTNEDAREFFERYYVRENAILTLVGAVDREQAEAIAERLSGALRAGERAPALPEPTVKAETQRIAFPSTQAHLFVGMPLIRRDDPDYFELLVANHILGGQSFNSRLFQDLRTRQGLAYSVFSVLQPLAVDGPFVAGMQTAAAQADHAERELLAAIDDWLENGVTEDEFAAAVDNLVNGFPLTIASNSAMVGQLAAIGFYGLPDDWLDTWVERVRAVEREAMMERLRERFRPDALSLIVVGATDGGLSE